MRLAIALLVMVLLVGGSDGETMATDAPSTVGWRSVMEEGLQGWLSDWPEGSPRGDEDAGRDASGTRKVGQVDEPFAWPPVVVALEGVPDMSSWLGTSSASMSTVAEGKEGKTLDAWVTIFSCPPYCGAMYNGEEVYAGAAACGWELPIGARFIVVGDPTGRTYVCTDRGLGGDVCGCLWVDVYFEDEAAGWAWLAQVGERIEVR